GAKVSAVTRLRSESRIRGHARTSSQVSQPPFQWAWAELARGRPRWRAAIVGLLSSAPMSLRDQARQWAKQHTDQLRSDPKGWAKSQQQRLRKVVDVAPFSDAALARELGDLRARMGRLEDLD